MTPEDVVINFIVSNARIELLSVAMLAVGRAARMASALRS